MIPASPFRTRFIIGSFIVFSRWVLNGAPRGCVCVLIWGDRLTGDADSKMAPSRLSFMIALEVSVPKNFVLITLDISRKSTRLIIDYPVRM